MSFLTVNNYPVPIASGSVTNSPDKGDNFNRSINGNLSGTITYEKEEFDLQTPILHPAKAKAIRGLIEGYGHNFSFDTDLYSVGKGLSPSDYSNVTLVASGGKFGGYLQIGERGYIEYDLSNALSSIYNYSEWTVMLWADFENQLGEKKYYFASPWQPAVIDYDADMVFNHYAVTSSGREYQNGRLLDENLDWITVNNKIFRIQDDSLKDYNIDDLVILPFECDFGNSNELCEMLHSFYLANASFSDLPFLKMNGDITDDTELEMKGFVNSYDYQGYSDSGTWVNNGKVLDMKFREK